MNSFFIDPEDFWNWFDRSDTDRSGDHLAVDIRATSNGQRNNRRSRYGPQPPAVPKPDSLSKRIKKTAVFQSSEEFDTDDASGPSVSHPSIVYDILFGPHKPGKKNKTWESDGYLSLVGSMVHVFDMKDRMLEDPTILDDVDLKCIEDLGELRIGNTEVQVIERRHTK